MRGGIDAYWRSANTSNETVYIHGDFGERFGMSRDRFKIIRRYFRCSRPADTTVVTAGAPAVPETYVKQLAIGGRLVIPVGDNTEDLKMMRITKISETQTKSEVLQDCKFVPLKGSHGWK
jgi:hypothetical protein